MKSFLQVARAVFGRSGGVGYHVAALQFSEKLWDPFRKKLAEDLNRRIEEQVGGGQPVDYSKLHLHIIGVSGGYCLDPEFLSKFGKLSAVDIDPLAGFIFRKRQAREFRFIRQDFFLALETAGWSLSRWLRDSRGENASEALRPVFLFSNLLGQLEFVLSPERLEAVSQGLAHAFREKGMLWLSFHDRVSVPYRENGLFFRRVEKRLSSEELARIFYADFPNVLPMRGKPIEIEEHFIGDWIGAASADFTYVSWRLTVTHAQLIEVCSSV